MEVRNVQLPEAQLGGTAPTDAASGARRPAPADRATATESAEGDTIRISPQARQAILVDRLTQQVLRLPDARPEAVAAARAALERGDLDTPAALDATADAILAAD